MASEARRVSPTSEFRFGFAVRHRMLGCAREVRSRDQVRVGVSVRALGVPAAPPRATAVKRGPCPNCPITQTVPQQDPQTKTGTSTRRDT